MLKLSDADLARLRLQALLAARETFYRTTPVGDVVEEKYVRQLADIMMFYALNPEPDDPLA